MKKKRKKSAIPCTVKKHARAAAAHVVQTESMAMESPGVVLYCTAPCCAVLYRKLDYRSLCACGGGGDVGAKESPATKK